MKRYAQVFWLFIFSLLIGACASPSPRVQTPVQPVESAPAAPTPAPVADPIEIEQPKATKVSPIVRVLIGESLKEGFIKHSGRINVYTLNGDKKYKISQEGTVSVKALTDGQIMVGTLKSAQPIVIAPVNCQLTWNNDTYTGLFYVFPVPKNKFNLVEFVSLEDYLHGVLPYEMSPSWPVDALKAQAVAARTYTLKSLENVRTKTFDLYSDVRSQMYRGTGKRHTNVTRAVDETRGEVLTHNGKIFFTYYHANCGGGTDDVKSWNFKAPSQKPLSGASCKYDTTSKNYTWKMTLSRAKVENFAHNAGLGGTLRSMKVSNKTSTGRATHLTISTSKGNKTVSCPQFRSTTGIKSCKITKITTTDKGVLFEGKGYGHGVGMCQDGAKGMAQQGKTYKEILKHYYPDSKITQLK